MTPGTVSGASQFRHTGVLFLVSAPSGAGKTTLFENLRTTPDLVHVITCTTRQPRAGEEPGVDYHFLTEADFLAKQKRGEFIEHARVHGFYYAAPIEPIKEALLAGKDVLLAVEVQGAATVRANPDPVIRQALADIFIMPPTLEELERRLRKRGLDSEEQIQIRLATAQREMNSWKDYKYTILSSSTEEDLTKFRAILRAERYLSSRLVWQDASLADVK